LRWGLREFFRAAPNITSVIAATREHGRLVTARAYADWTQPSLAIDAPNLYRAGIEPVYAQGRHQVDGTPVKNSADVRLAVDTVALCNQLPHVRTYVLVTGNGDLVHPLNYIRLNGHRVVVIAVGATISTLLQSAADKVLVYERDVEPLEAQRIVPVEHARPLEEAMTRLRQVLPPLLAAQRTKQSFTAVNEQLLTPLGCDWSSITAGTLGTPAYEPLKRANAEPLNTRLNTRRSARCKVAEFVADPRATESLDRRGDRRERTGWRRASSRD
jgi:hypothetical protein